MAKNTGKVGEFCQSRKVGTLIEPFTSILVKRHYLKLRYQTSFCEAETFSRCQMDGFQSIKLESSLLDENVKGPCADTLPTKKFNAEP